MNLISFSLPVVLLLASGLISVIFGFYIFTRRRAPGSTELGFISLFISAWSVAYAFELGTSNLQDKIFWAKMAYPGIPFVPFFWLLFTAAYTRGEKRVHRLIKIYLLGIIPLVTTVLAYTNEWHNLMWTRFFIKDVAGHPFLFTEHGTWFWVHAAFSYLFILGGTVLILRSLWHREKNLYWMQSTILFISVLLPWLGNILYFTTPIAIDPTPFAFLVTVLLLAWAVFGYHLVDITPIARNLVVENMREGLLVLDLQGRIVDINPAAAQFIGLPAAQVIGKPAVDVLKPWQSLLERFRDVLDANEIIEVGLGESARKMGVRVSPLRDERQNLVGRLIIFWEMEPASYPAGRFDEPVTQPLPAPQMPPQELTSESPVWRALRGFFTPPFIETHSKLHSSPLMVQIIERVFTIVTRILVVIGTAVFLFSFPFGAPISDIPQVILLWPFILAVIGYLSFARRIEFAWRASIFVYALLALAIVELLNYGYSPDSFAYFLVFVTISSLFMGWRWGLVNLGMALIALSVMGLVISLGGYMPPAVPAERILPDSLQAFLLPFASFTLSALVLFAITVFFLSTIATSQQREAQNFNLLQQERNLLERRVRERTTDLKDARDLALQSRDELRTYYRAMEQSGSSIVITDTQGNIQYVNPFFEKITGYSMDEVLGKNSNLLSSGRQSKEFYRHMWQTISNGKVWQGEFLNRRKDGSTYWEFATIAPVKDDNEKITNYVAIKEDVTAKKELRETLARQNEYLSALQNITIELLNRRNQQDLLDNIMQRAQALLKASRSVIVLEENGQLIYRAVMGEPTHQIGQPALREPMKLLWKAFETRRPVVVNNYTAKFGPRPQDESRPPLRAVADFPILSGNRALGVIGVARNNDQAFTDADIEFGQALAQIAALVLDNINLYDSALRELEERKRIQSSLEVSEHEQRALAGVLQIGMGNDALENILADALNSLLAIEWLGIESKGGIFLKDPQRDVLDLVVESNLSQQICALCKKVEFGHCLCGRAALTRQLQFSSHVDDLHEIAYDGMPDHGHYNVPILSGQETLGVIVLYLPPGYIYAEQDALFLQAFASTISNVIRRKQFEASIQQFLQDMKALQEIYLSLSQVEDLDELYIQMITLTQTRLGLDRVGLFVLSKDGKTLQGTFGINPQGMLRDERYFEEPITPDHWTNEIDNAPNHTKLWTHAPLYDDSGVVGHGWKVSASLWNGHQSLGYLVCDTLLSGRPPRPYEAELISQLGSTFGHLIERKRAEKELAIARDQALDASRFKSQLLSRVSHELRTPLGGVLGYAELLHQGAFGELTDEQLDAANNIVASANYLNVMIDELLDQAQIEARAIQIHMAPFKPKQMLHNAQLNMSVLAHNKGLQFISELDPSLPPQLIGDERRLQQVIVNLAGNAIKFTQQGEVRLSLLRLSDAQWAIRVADTGAGIPKDAQDYIFDPFRQVDNAITRYNRGTGLGLSITKQLVELMGGKIELVSDLGQGSTFTIILPIQIPAGA